MGASVGAAAEFTTGAHPVFPAPPVSFKYRLVPVPPEDDMNVEPTGAVTTPFGLPEPWIANVVFSTYSDSTW